MAVETECKGVAAASSNAFGRQYEERCAAENREKAAEEQAGKEIEKAEKKNRKSRKKTRGSLRKGLAVTHGV